MTLHLNGLFIERAGDFLVHEKTTIYSTHVRETGGQRNPRERGAVIDSPSGCR